MARLIGLLAFSIVMFAAAAGASWWWQQQAAAAHAGEAASDPHADTGSHPAAEAAAPADVVSHHAAEGGPVEEAHGIPAGDLGLPVAVRTRPMSIEELLRYGLSLNAREESLEKHEDEFRQREARLKLALADLQGEQVSIDGLRTQIQQQLSSADGVLTKIQQERQELAQQQAEARAEFERSLSLQSTPSEGELANLKRMASWIRAMEPAKAGELLREMANDGRMETAARILSNLEERDAARVLDSLGETKLVSDLITEYQKLRPTTKPAGKGR